ncbi:MAG: hypothetical protein OXE99_04265, partial [Cellvibrionales bacterium]|nr:hypothetical protein [Cellvibrionales bacterium]
NKLLRRVSESSSLAILKKPLEDPLKEPLQKLFKVNGVVCSKFMHILKAYSNGKDSKKRKFSKNVKFLSNFDFCTALVSPDVVNVKKYSPFKNSLFKCSPLKNSPLRLIWTSSEVDLEKLKDFPQGVYYRLSNDNKSSTAKVVDHAFYHLGGGIILQSWDSGMIKFSKIENSENSTLVHLDYDQRFTSFGDLFKNKQTEEKIRNGKYEPFKSQDI